MEAPDKIYIHVRTEPRPSITFSEVPEKNSTNEEYIRKDALLELVKLTYGKTSMNPFDCSEAFEELIEKIESL